MCPKYAAEIIEKAVVEMQNFSQKAKICEHQNMFFEAQ